MYEAGYWPDGSPFYAMKLIAGDTLQARILRAKLPLLDTWNEQRRAIARAGCELVHGRDTFSQRLGELLPLLSNTTGASRLAAGTGSPGRRA